MKILDVLAKLGIFRAGAKTATYRGGADRPAEFLMDDVYDAERDLTNAKDVEAARRATKRKCDGVLDR